LFVAFVGVAALLQGQAIERRVAEVSHYGLLDRSPERVAAAPDPIDVDNTSFRRFDSELTAQAALKDGKIRGYFMLGSEYMKTGRVRFVLGRENALDDLESDGAEQALRQWLRRRLLERYAPSEVVERIVDPMLVERERVATEAVSRPEPAQALVKLIVPFVVGFLLVMALVGTSSYLVQAVAGEKENRVVEVLLSLADAEEILLGKLIGLGIAGLAQFAVWSALLVLAMLGATIHLSNAGFDIPWLALLVATAYFIIGYFFVGSLMLATGSFGTTARESQQYAVAWSMLVVLPVALSSLLVLEPHGAIGRAFTWIPFTSPVTVPLRLSLDPEGVALWEVLGSLLVLGLSTALSVRLGARLFRVGLLLTGSRLDWRALLRQARLKG
jgi:ABC-2 type transport system permease protein